MGIIKTVREQLLDERAKNEALEAENARLRADLAYVAMMADVELDEEEESNHE